MSSLVVRPPVAIGAPRARASRARLVPRRALRRGRGSGHVGAVGTLGRVVARASGADGDTSADAPESSPRGSNAESTISALDALLGVDADPEPDVAPPRVPDPESASRATVSLLPAETSVTRSRAESLGAVRGALTDEPAPSTPSRRSDPLDAYDPEFDPLGLGPRWGRPLGPGPARAHPRRRRGVLLASPARSPRPSSTPPSANPTRCPSTTRRRSPGMCSSCSTIRRRVPTSSCAPRWCKRRSRSDSSPPSPPRARRYPPGGSNSQSRATYHPKNSSGEGVTGSRTRKRREETNAETREETLGIRFDPRDSTRNAAVVARRCPRCAGVRWISSARRRARQR